MPMQTSSDLPELWDLYDSAGNPLSRRIVRGSPMLPGEFHRLVQIWVRNAAGAYLVQQRADNELWAATAGCVAAGEESRQTAQRELAEEMGLDVEANQLRQVGVSRSQHALGTAWLVEVEVELDQLPLQSEEVLAAAWLTTDQIRRLVEHGIFYDYGTEHFERIFTA